MKKNKTTLYAVYGTLRTGEGNRPVLENSKSLGVFNTPPNSTMVSIGGGFPGVIPKGDTSIVMEVFEVKDEQIKRNLDSLEGYYPNNLAHSMYLKKEIETPFGKAFYYIWNRSIEGYNQIITGDWKNKKILKKNEVLPTTN